MEEDSALPFRCSSYGSLNVYVTEVPGRKNAETSGKWKKKKKETVAVYYTEAIHKSKQLYQRRLKSEKWMETPVAEGKQI